MWYLIQSLFIAVLCVGLTGASLAGEKGQAKGHTGKGLQGMSQEQQIKLALSAAPPQIGNEASVKLAGEDGKLIEVRKGTNGFTCIPTVNSRPDPDPMCFDAAVEQWVDALQADAPKPTNAVPGISYMARGGFHWEKDGKVLMKQEPGAKLVKEPSHWMLMWPFESKTTGLPTLPNQSGVWIMLDGTPYAHLMVYQDPMKMKDRK